MLTQMRVSEGSSGTGSEERYEAENKKQLDSAGKCVHVCVLLYPCRNDAGLSGVISELFFWRPPRPSASLDLPLDHLSVLLCDTLITLPLSQGPNSVWHRASDTFTSELKRGSAAFVPQTCL